MKQKKYKIGTRIISATVAFAMILSASVLGVFAENKDSGANIKLTDSGIKPLLASKAATAPAIEIDYVSEKLKSFTATDHTISISGESDVSIADPAETYTHEINESWFGKTLQIKKVDSPDAVQSLEIPARPTMDDFHISGVGNKLSGITDKMEYKKSTDTAWIAGTGENISGLTLGDNYNVRIKATETSFKSAEKVVTIAEAIYATVTYNSNSGYGEMISSTFEIDVTSKLRPVLYAKDGHIFAGWNTKADGTGTSYADMGEITLSEDITLYAQWKLPPADGTTDWNDDNSIVFNNDSGIPDIALYQVLLDNGDASIYGDGNQDGMLTVKEAKNIKEVAIQSGENPIKVKSLKNVSKLKGLISVLLVAQEITDISELKDLNILWLDLTGVKTISNKEETYKIICGFKNLETLRLDGFDLNGRLDELSSKKFGWLTLKSCKLDNADAQYIFNNYPSLWYFGSWHNDFDDITGISKLQNLISVVIDANDANYSPNNMKEFKGLEEIGKLPNLSMHLSLSNIKVDDLSNFFGANKAEIMIFNGCGLKSIAGIEKFAQLRELNLGDNQLTSLDGVEKLTKLYKLYAHNNKLSRLPDLTKSKNLCHFWSHDGRYDVNMLYFGGNKLAAAELIAKLPTHVKELPGWSEWLKENAYVPPAGGGGGGTSSGGGSSSSSSSAPAPSVSVADNGNVSIANPDTTISGNKAEVAIPSVDVSSATASKPIEMAINLPTESLIEMFSGSSAKVDIDISIPANIANNPNVSIKDINMDKDIFKEAKKSGKTVTINISKSNGDLIAEWSFDGKNMSNILDTNLSLNVKNNVSKPGMGNVASVNFNHSGVLPGTASVSLDVSNQFVAGDVLSLYYYNTATGKLEKVSDNIAVDSNGKSTIKISHCSEYILVKSSSTANIITPSLNPQTGDSWFAGLFF